MSSVIKQLESFAIGYEISGTAPIIQNKFSQKSLEEMLRKHMNISTQKEPKRPAEVIEAATQRNRDGLVCMPPTAFKKAMLTASTQIKNLKKTQLRTSLFIEGQSIPLRYGAMIPRMDMVRTAGINRTPDVRFRPEFQDWSARLIIQYADTLNIRSVTDLLNRAGSVGVGEWRPEKDGNYGTFEVVRAIDDVEELEEIRKACRSPLQGLSIPTWALNAEIAPALLQRIAAGSTDDEIVTDEAAE